MACGVRGERRPQSRTTLGGRACGKARLAGGDTEATWGSRAKNTTQKLEVDGSGQIQREFWRLK